MPRISSPMWSEQDFEEACEWFVEFRTGVPDSSRREVFHAWLQQSPAHMGAYLEATTVWNVTASFVPGAKYSIDALIAAAAEERDNVRSLSPKAATQVNSGRKPTRARYFALVASLILIMIGFVSVGFWRSSQTYTTAIGEQRSVVLKDGSIIQLNSRSRVSVRYTDHARKIELEEGQALFTVAHDSQRPFWVSAGNAAVRAVGTQFDVNRLETETVVTVLEGRVTVDPGLSKEAFDSPTSTQADPSLPVTTTSSEPASPLVLAAGEQLRLVRSGEIRAARADVGATTAWTQRRLVFDGTPLADVVEEFNRYNARPLHLKSPHLKSFQVDGVFSSTDPDPMIRFLRSRPGIVVTETETAIEIAEK